MLVWLECSSAVKAGLCPIQIRRLNQRSNCETHLQPRLLQYKHHLWHNCPPCTMKGQVKQRYSLRSKSGTGPAKPPKANADDDSEFQRQVREAVRKSRHEYPRTYHRATSVAGRFGMPAASTRNDETHGSKKSTRARPHQTVLIPDFVDHFKKLNMMSETFSGHHPYYSRNFPEYQSDAPELESADEAECQICLESLPLVDFLTVAGCLHRFCCPCMSKHAGARISDGELQVKCPQEKCSNNLTLTQCSALLPSESFELLTKKQTEAAIPEKEKVYCPFPDCSTLMAKPVQRSERASSSLDLWSSQGHPTEVTFVECEECHRAFCMVCAVPWHGYMTCAEYKESVRKKGETSGDEELRKLADKFKWRKCKHCGRVIELKYGCNHITCLCGHEFCYVCGAEWRNRHATCRCMLWDEANIRKPLDH